MRACAVANATAQQTQDPTQCRKAQIFIGLTYHRELVVTYSYSSDTTKNSGPFAGLSNDDIRTALASREQFEVRGAVEATGGMEAPAAGLDDASLRRKISQRAYGLIVEFETGGRAYYESPHGINSRPCWPGGASGVTIGCGYDLGYYSQADFAAAWTGKLSASDISVLSGAIGMKGQSGRAFMPRVSHIVIPWGVALKVFDDVNLPKVLRTTLSKLPRAADLHPHCVGVLASLVFNRGASFGLSGDRYREMREIARLIANGEPAGVPEQIRDMKRLWEGTGQNGLLIRRNKEAQLFQDGLDAKEHQQAGGGGTETLFSRAMLRSEVEGAGGRRDLKWLNDLTDDQLDAVLYGNTGAVEGPPADVSRGGAEASAIRYDKSDVSWVKNDQNHPDYVHLPPDFKGSSFKLVASDLERLVKLNRFQPHVGQHKKVIFALRGAKLTNGSKAVEGASELELTDVRPDHFAFRCIIGVWDRTAGKLSAYLASTVCNAGSVVACYNYYNHFSPTKQGNILLTGCYEMCVGTHYGHVEVPGVFRLGNGSGPQNATKHVVLRTANDVTFGTQDVFDPCVPQDNLHPSFHPSNSKYSSLGCLTVHGTYDGEHLEEWAHLRAAAGLHSAGDGIGTRYDMIMLTGLDAATAAALRTHPDAEADDVLGCLRQGSRGEEVKRLQLKLGTPPSVADGVFGWQTAVKLVERQQSVLGWASATYGRRMDTLLGFNVF